MKFKLYIFILIIIGIFLYIIPKNYNKKNNEIHEIEYIKEIADTEKKEVIIDEPSNKPITNNEQNYNKASGSSSNTTSNINKDDKKSNTNINSNVVNENKVEFNSTQVENNSTQEENYSTQEVEKQNPWDDLGITEDDYYNKPMWSWARVDYSIKKYKSPEQTQQACINDGNEMLEEILSFSCTSINSYSGDYLGEMLRIKY